MTTFVLVHGAFEGGWVWQRVAQRLLAKGHRLYTPTLTGCGSRAHLLSPDITLETHVNDVVGEIEMEDLSDLVLVGHSYGGSVVTVVADRVAGRVRRLVYLDAAAPSHGQASTGAFATGTADRLNEMSAGDEWLLPPLPLRAVGITDPDDVAWVGDRRKPHPVRTLHEPVMLSTGDGDPPYPVSYIIHTDNAAMVELFGVDPLAPFKDKATAKGWRTRSINAGHDAMVTHADAVAEALDAEARSA